MKLLKQLLSWFKNLFRTKDQITKIEVKQMKVIIEKMEDTRTNKEKRDWWLMSKGYTVRPKPKNKFKKTKAPTSYQEQIIRFCTLKSKGLIEIYYSKRNRQGIPYFEIRKTVKEQLSTITVK